MLALDIMLLVLAQSAPVAPVPRPDVEVVGPATRMICRTIMQSGSHIASRRICRTAAEFEEIRDRMQNEGERDVRSTMRRTDEMLEHSGYGNWIRSRTETPAGMTDARPVQTCRIRMGAAGC